MASCCALTCTKLPNGTVSSPREERLLRTDLQDAANEPPLLPIPVTAQRRPDPRLALTVGVAGWIAKPSDFGGCPALICVAF